MDVPLHAERTITPAGEQKLTIWSRGEPRVVDPPLLPYCYARRPFDGTGSMAPVRQERVEARALSTLEPGAWVRATFRNVRDLAATAHGREPGEVADANIPFVHRVLLDEPDFYRQWPNGPPRVLTFDVEQLTSGKTFPTGKDPLISIAWAVDDGEPTCAMGDGESDRDILEALLEAIEREDPDLLVGYNVAGYDLPMVIKRLRANGQDVQRLTRAGGRVHEDDARGSSIPGRSGPRLVGRLVYDVFASVRADQTLFGIKDRKLKTVAKWRGIDVIEEDVSDTRTLVGTDRLERYNISDVEATRRLASPYLSNLTELADFYGAPLATVMEATANFHCTTLQGRIMRRHGVVSDGTNGERFPELYASTGGEGFVGGIVALYQRGLFRPVTKVDFASMYPSILVGLGAGAENTKYRGEVAEGPYQARRSGDTLELLVPDPSRDTRHRITIEGRSELAEQLGELLDYRLELKAGAKAATTDADREKATARQGMVKVILNSVYGVMASRHARYASLPVAMAIVGTARHLIREVEALLGEAKIETDTDGVYADGHVDPAPIEAHVNRFMEEVIGGEPVLRVDADGYEAGWFHQGKNYVLLHHDGRLETHGVAFKGSSRAPLFDRGLHAVAHALLSGQDDVDDVAGRVLDLDRYAPEDFVMRVRLGKDPDQYAAANHVAPQVARAAMKRGMEPKRGDQLPYIKTRTGYDVPWEGAFAELDRAYYQDLLVKLLDRLGVQATPKDQTSLAEFL